jgi:rhodanese-related sulfurtransferase
VSEQQIDEKHADAPAEIFGRAGRRGHEQGLSYAGAVTPAEAYQLAQAKAATIVDVRTPEEWRDVGHVEGPSLVVWPRSGGEAEVRNFLVQLQELYDPSQPLLFLCRTGVRSHYAAHVATAAGFQKAYNILEGFEGHPGAGDGWRAAGLPWKKC